MRKLYLISIAATAVALTAGVVSARAVGAFDRPTAAPPTVMKDVAQRDVQIAAWQKALDADPQSAIALSQLAALHLQRARETGDFSDYLRAEALARRSLELRENRNGKTFVLLASALLAQHRFEEAFDVAQRLVAAEPDVVQYRALLGEVALELGRYDVAARSLDSLAATPARTELSIAPRLARWAELTGHADRAGQILRAAIADATHRTDLPREQVAWFYLRLGDLDLRTGRMRAAEESYRAGLAIEPADYRLLSAMARLESAVGHPRKAVEYGERAVATILDPATLGVVAEAYEAMGDSAKAAEYTRTMEVAVSAEPGPYHRAWSLFLLDHGRRVDEVRASAEAELRTRKDIYGYDVLAWARYKQGRATEARVAIDSALRLGTQDPTLFYHAGMIARAAGDDAAARRYLGDALALNPEFHSRHAGVARAVLDSLEHR